MHYIYWPWLLPSIYFCLCLIWSQEHRLQIECFKKNAKVKKKYVTFIHSSFWRLSSPSILQPSHKKFACPNFGHYGRFSPKSEGIPYIFLSKVRTSRTFFYILHYGHCFSTFCLIFIIFPKNVVFVIFYGKLQNILWKWEI